MSSNAHDHRLPDDLCVRVIYLLAPPPSPWETGSTAPGGLSLGWPSLDSWRWPGWSWPWPWSASWGRHVPAAVLAAILAAAQAAAVVQPETVSPLVQVAVGAPASRAVEVRLDPGLAAMRWSRKKAVEAALVAQVAAPTLALPHAVGMARPASPATQLPVPRAVSVRVSPGHAEMRTRRGNTGSDSAKASSAAKRQPDAALAGGQHPATARRVTSIEEKAAWMREQQAAPSLPEPQQCAATERHYTIAEVAVLWSTSKDSVRRIFQDERGVLVFGDTGSPHKRRYQTLRIPQSVLERVHRRLTNV